jgi:hypothetical protein
VPPPPAPPQDPMDSAALAQKVDRLAPGLSGALADTDAPARDVAGLARLL